MEAATIASINSMSSQVYQMGCQVDNLRGDLYELRKKLSDTSEALELHKKASSGFNTDDGGNESSISSIGAIPNVKLASRYSKAFKKTRSAKQDNAVRAASSISLSLEREIDRLEREIEAKEQMALSLEYQMDSLRTQINLLYMGG